MVKKTRTVHNPAKIARSQKTQRQETPATVINPVIKGEICHTPDQRDTHKATGRFGDSRWVQRTARERKTTEPSRESQGPTDHQAEHCDGHVSQTRKSMKDGTTYPLLVSGAAAKNPPRKRKMSRAAVLGANAFPT